MSNYVSSNSDKLSKELECFETIHLYVRIIEGCPICFTQDGKMIGGQVSCSVTGNVDSPVLIKLTAFQSQMDDA